MAVGGAVGGVRRHLRGLRRPRVRLVVGGDLMHPEHTGSRTTRVLGALTLAGFAAVLLLALVVSPPDQVQGDAARLIYVHVPVAIVMNLAFAVTAAGSVMWLWKKSRWWDTRSEEDTSELQSPDHLVCRLL